MNYKIKSIKFDYSAADLKALAEELKKEGINIVDEIETYDCGKSVYILDMEGKKIQLCEPYG